MPRAKFTKAKIRGIVSSIPQIEKRIDDEKDLYGGNIKLIEKIKKMVGLNVRYEADKYTTTSDLCENAANELLKGTGFDRSDIDCLIFITQTPDYFLPATASVLHKKLCLNKDCAAFDITLGCSGYVYGLWMAYSLIEAGGCNNVLLLAGETTSKIVHPKDKTTVPLFGDAGTATLIQRTEQPSPSSFVLYSDGTGYEAIMIPAGAFRMPKSPETAREVLDDDGNPRTLENLHLNGPDIFSFAINEVPRSVDEILNFSGVPKENIDAFIFHQANNYITDNIVKKASLPPEKVPLIIGKYGNQSRASIPTAICDLILGGGGKRSLTALLSGFGVGLSWANCIIGLDDIYVKIKKYEGGADR